MHLGQAPEGRVRFRRLRLRLLLLVLGGGCGGDDGLVGVLIFLGFGGAVADGFDGVGEFVDLVVGVGSHALTGAGHITLCKGPGT